MVSLTRVCAEFGDWFLPCLDVDASEIFEAFISSPSRIRRQTADRASSQCLPIASQSDAESVAPSLERAFQTDFTMNEKLRLQTRRCYSTN
ncbi:hypothetical protein DV706_19930 (plasmid) [Natronorubrum bangense]|uniref:Uncharacterized protein n=2 Tax=Natronorubrum bangense TaxID=61858 RepID=L9W7V8_9EURY|nr:hypothetical protein C494_15758 [Natronorubrum bangense JCM 10635]QCC56809.1 hypothetical protein DV706_19930 [Natronorubrum bangense]